MPKRKMTAGVLGRDKNEDDGYIAFYKGLRREDVKLTDNGFWVRKKGHTDDYTEFTPEDWKKTYDLKPPRRGTAFEVEIEL